MSNILQTRIREHESPSPQTTKSKPYDIYHDPNISEAGKCRPLLEDLAKRVDELLNEWPGHPSLKVVIK